MDGSLLRPKLALLFSACVLGCGDGDSPSMVLASAPAASSSATPPEPVAEQFGSLSFALQTEEGRFRKFSYAITGPSFSKSGAVDVSKSNTVSALIDGIPVGTDYSVSLSGSSVVPASLRCSGSAPFSISAGETTNVALSVACHTIDDTGEPEEPQEPEEPPREPTAAPLPMWTPALLGFALLGFGVVRARRRAQSSCALSMTLSK